MVFCLDNGVYFILLSHLRKKGPEMHSIKKGKRDSEHILGRLVKRVALTPISWLIFALAFLVWSLPIRIGECGKIEKNEVVIYTSVDQVFSEPILKKFEAKTSIKVKALYDTEAAKTVGLVNRLIAEKNHPRADVFWNSEIIRTILLKRRGILAPYRSANARDIPELFKDPDGYWTGFAGRVRVILVNKDMIAPADYPGSIQDLIDPKWRGAAGFSLPLFGTANTHALSLFQLWGIKKTSNFFLKLKKNDVQILNGNSVVRDRVADGLIKFGFVDIDDAYVAISNGKHVDIVYPDQSGIGTLLIPNTVALIAGAPHPENGKRLIDYLLSKRVEERLAFVSMQIPLRPGIKHPSRCPSLKTLKIMNVNYDVIAEKADKYSKILMKIFLK